MSEWKEYKIDDVILDYLDFRGKTPKKLGMAWGKGNIKALSANNVEKGKINFEKECYLASEELYKIWMIKGDCKKGDVVITMEAPLGNVAQIPDDNKYILSQRTLLFKTKKDIINNDYFFYTLSDTSFQDQLLKNSTGSTVVGIQQKKLAKLIIKIPTLQNQNLIASILQNIDSVIEKTQTIITKYKAVKQGLLQDLFTRGIDVKTGKLRPKYEDGPHLYKDSKLGIVPKEWTVDIFGEHIDLVHGHQFRNFDFTEFGVPVIKIGQVKPENVDLTNASFVSSSRMDEFKNETIKNGDVLMALTGATLGKACYVKGLERPVLQNYRVGRFEPKIKENEIDKSFLYYTLTGELLNQIFNKVNSGAQGNIGKADFEKALIKKPIYGEQILISEKLNSISQKIQTEQNYLEKLQQIKAGLMGDLLSGKKKVKTKS